MIQLIFKSLYFVLQQRKFQHIPTITIRSCEQGAPTQWPLWPRWHVTMTSAEPVPKDGSLLSLVTKKKWKDCQNWGKLPAYPISIKEILHFLTKAKVFGLWLTKNKHTGNLKYKFVVGVVETFLIFQDEEEEVIIQIGQAFKKILDIVVNKHFYQRRQIFYQDILDSVGTM